MRSNQYTVTTTAQIVVPADNIAREIYIHVLGAGTVYLGHSNVTTANGFLTEKNALPYTLKVPAGENIYALVGTGTEDLRVLTPDLD
jgi:hypothetical protein